VAENCRDITVHAASFDGRGGPVFYAALPCSSGIFQGRRDDDSDRHHLVSALWDHLTAMESLVWKNLQSSRRGAFPIHVVHGPLGRPRLMLGEHRGPAISFSKSGGKIWAALCGDQSHIGIDVAGTDEFQKEYPFHRVFNEQELYHALILAGGKLGGASALLWSIKEAVVKALGCAFHLVAPQQVTVYPSIGGNGEYIFPVRLSKEVPVRRPTGGGRFIWVCSFARANTWLSIALLGRQSR
jgi:phosphopantetheinyl transferase (holo-ACP synthase)